MTKEKTQSQLQAQLQAQQLLSPEEIRIRAELGIPMNQFQPLTQKEVEWKIITDSDLDEPPQHYDTDKFEELVKEQAKKIFSNSPRFSSYDDYISSNLSKPSKKPSLDFKKLEEFQQRLKNSRIPFSTEFTLVIWPESQNLMEYPWFEECILMNDKAHMPRLGSSAYFVPTNRYQLYKSKENGEKTEKSST